MHGCANGVCKTANKVWDELLLVHLLRHFVQLFNESGFLDDMVSRANCEECKTDNQVGIEDVTDHFTEEVEVREACRRVLLIVVEQIIVQRDLLRV